MLDDELIAAMRQELPEGMPAVFFSSLTGQGLMDLKDTIWKALHDRGEN